MTTEEIEALKVGDVIYKDSDPEYRMSYRWQRYTVVSIDVDDRVLLAEGWFDPRPMKRSKLLQSKYKLLPTTLPVEKWNPYSKPSIEHVDNATPTHYEVQADIFAPDYADCEAFQCLASMALSGHHTFTIRTADVERAKRIMSEADDGSFRMVMICLNMNRAYLTPYAKFPPPNVNIVAV